LKPDVPLRNKSLFACFSSEKEDSCCFSEEKEPKRGLCSALANNKRAAGAEWGWRADPA
jgi:hypothetical protein